MFYWSKCVALLKTEYFLHPVDLFRASVAGVKNNGLFLCSGIHRAALTLSSPVTEQTAGQVINSGATTLNLACRRGCFRLPLSWCVPAVHRAVPRFSANKLPQNCGGNLPDPLRCSRMQSSLDDNYWLPADVLHAALWYLQLLKALEDQIKRNLTCAYYRLDTFSL